MNANNKMQLNDLKIKSLIEFAKNDDQKPAKFKEDEYGFKRIGMSLGIEFVNHFIIDISYIKHIS